MTTDLACPICTMTDVLDAPDQYECAVCGHEWPKSAALGDGPDGASVADANGNLLVTGDAVTVIKDLKVKGSSMTLKAGTKIKNIRIVEGDHDVDCKVDGMGVMLKSKFLKKA
jgi:protein PhnA